MTHNKPPVFDFKKLLVPFETQGFMTTIKTRLIAHAHLKKPNLSLAQIRATLPNNWGIVPITQLKHFLCY